MKRNALLILIAVIAFTSCTDRKLQTYVANVPVYMSYEELRSPVQVTSEQELVQPGKIYFKDNYMYINEFHKGIHVVDLSDPSNPQVKAFIEVPGNVDMAIRNDVLYADSYVDLVLIDISNPLQPAEVKRMEDLFEYVIPPYDYDYPLDEIDQERGVVTGFLIEEITREVHINPYPWPIYQDYAFAAESGGRPMTYPAGSGDTYGVGGSMARFLTYDDYLYVLESTYLLKSIDISNTDEPEMVHKQNLWGNVETIFISGEYMYVGAANGMHILSLDEPAAPNPISTYQHITSCDPVVVAGDRAYVTLRSGNNCGGNQDLLEVIDISNKSNPSRMASFDMTEPYGLGIDNSTLFVCEGEHGLKVYDATNPYSITDHKIAEFTDIHAHDVIPLSSFLFMIGEDGFYIYDYSDLQDIFLMGTLPVSPTAE
ncbi:MAG: hypothetical protein ABFS10_14765 [Bacteroidota bacterium]